jgi:hypothetical protein
MHALSLRLLPFLAALLLAAAQHWLVSPLASLPIVPAQRRLRSAPHRVHQPRRGA